MKLQLIEPAAELAMDRAALDANRAIDGDALKVGDPDAAELVQPGRKRPLGDGVEAVLDPGPRRQYEGAASVDVPRQLRRLLGVADVQARRDDEPIATEVLEVRQHVDTESEPAQRLVVAQHSRLVAEDVVGGLNLKRKPRVVVVDERDVRLRRRGSEHRAQELQLGAQRLEICVAAARGTVGLEDAVPVLLRPEAGRSPAKEKHSLGSVRDRLVRP